MNNQNQNTKEAVQSTDTLTRDFVTATLVVSVMTNFVVFVTWLTVSLA